MDYYIPIAILGPHFFMFEGAQEPVWGNSPHLMNTLLLTSRVHSDCEHICRCA